MKFYLISDNIDTQMGMRLAGIEGVVAHTEPEVTAALDAAFEDESIAVVLMTEKLVKLCHDYGIATFLWDTGNGQFDRSTNTWRSEQMHSALLRAVSGEDYTPEKAA